ncbi:mycofactocin oligosaccharide methyltransferase MftM [Amycolatopsis alkalitolerans]|uniref:Class I SAM-dependent methyltransferase n=1 Tax=Amycolatopsis alkalitolerans TaxID=2547244 RepID=A0A5C4LUH1_9PSEU|nr:mycofactocin oligosaccharide methyltransferase MftM [Amycolatopsis alkalitolerans]TNC21531.1 class I SAM-dependent methyltransferase [Amycolatopsis alkalitolerans]
MTAALDPLAPYPVGQYLDDLVRVVRAEEDRRPSVVRTEHFRLHRTGRRIEVSHRLRPDQLDNGLTGLLIDELFAPGWLAGQDVFERVFTGVVRSTVADPGAAWGTFYANTLAHLREPSGAPPLIAGIAPVYARVLRLVPPGSVLDLGSCFGFLPLMLAERPRTTVVASDLVAGTTRLLAKVAAERGIPLRTLVCDATRVPLPDGCVDTVTVVHLLEHLDPAQGCAVLAEATRLARSAVIVAVPFEEVPAADYGHVRRFDLPALAALGAATGWHHKVSAFHGGWLVLDRSGRSKSHQDSRHSTRSTR